MASFAVIETGGKQYKVSAGDKVRIEKINAAPGAGFTFDKVLLLAEQHGESQRESAPAPSRVEGSRPRESAWDVRVGTPYIPGANVEAKVLQQARDRKKIVFKYHSKTRYRKKKGHRQPFSEVQIVSI